MKTDQSRCWASAINLALEAASPDAAAPAGAGTCVARSSRLRVREPSRCALLGAKNETSGPAR